MEDDIEIVWNFILDYNTTEGGKNLAIDRLVTCVVMDGASTITLIPTSIHDGRGSRIQVCYRGKDDTRFDRTRYIDDFFNTISRPITLTSEQVLNLAALHGL